jgi:hypothetical protein
MAGPKGFELFAHPPDPTPDDDPSLGKHVDRSQCLGGQDERTVGQDHNSRQQFGRGRDARQEAQQGERLQILPLRLSESVILSTGAARIRGLDTLRKDDVVRNGEDAKAHRLALLRQRGYVFRRRQGTAWWQSKAEVHECLTLLCAHSSDRDHPIHSIMNTDASDHERSVAPARASRSERPSVTAGCCHRQLSRVIFSWGR